MISSSLFAFACSFVSINRDTPAAKIFRMKSEEDFRHSMVVTPALKWMVWLFVIVLNLGMIFFTMLRGLERGHDWQVSGSTLKPVNKIFSL